VPGLGADKNGMQHAWQHEIGDELPLPGQQPIIFAPQQRAPDIRRIDVAHGLEPRCGGGSVRQLLVEDQPIHVSMC
jgi:hypothetical protein